MDWVLCNEKGSVGNLVVGEPLGTSDHNMVEFFVKVDNDSETRVLNLSKGNYDGMRHELAMMDWETLLKGKTVDRQWQAFKE